jgi:hypothetical protein
LNNQEGKPSNFKVNIKNYIFMKVKDEKKLQNILITIPAPKEEKNILLIFDKIKKNLNIRFFILFVDGN